MLMNSTCFFLRPMEYHPIKEILFTPVFPMFLFNMLCSLKALLFYLQFKS